MMEENSQRPSQCHFVNEAYETQNEPPYTEPSEVQGTPYINQVQPSQYRWYHINVDALPFKLSFLFLGFMEGSYEPFLNLFLVDIGLSTTQAGIVSGLRMLGMFTGSVLFGMLTDYTGRRKLLFFLAAFGALGLMLPQPWVFAAVTSISSNNSASASMISETRSGAMLNTSLGKNSTSDMTSIEVACTDNLFITAIFIHFMTAAFDGYLNILGEANTMNFVMESARPVAFGRQRLFNPFGAACSALLASALVEIMPINGVISIYSVKHFVYSASVLFLFMNNSFLMKSSKTLAKVNSPRSGILKKLLLKTKEIDVMFFLVTCFVLGVLNGLDYNFLFIYMKENGSPSIFLGASIASGSIVGVLCYWVASQMINFVGGPMNFISISSLSYLVRFFMYAYTPSPYMFVISSMLNGVGYSMFIVSAMQHTENISSDEMKTTMFGLVSGIIHGLANMVSNIFGGMIYQTWSGKYMYCGGGLIGGLWGVFVFVFVIIRRRRFKKASV